MVLDETSLSADWATDAMVEAADGTELGDTDDTELAEEELEPEVVDVEVLGPTPSVRPVVRTELSPRVPPQKIGRKFVYSRGGTLDVYAAAGSGRVVDVEAVDTVLEVAAGPWRA